MRRVSIVVCLTVLAVACSKNSGRSGGAGLTGPSPIGQVPVQVLWMSDAGNQIAVGDVIQLELRGKDPDGVERAFTGDAVWISDNTAVATVAADGRVSGKQSGTANVVASYGGLTATKTIEVLPSGTSPGGGGTGGGDTGGGGTGGGGTGGGGTGGGGTVGGGTGGGTGTGTGTTVLSLTIGGSATVNVGAATQITVTARLSDGSTLDVTNLTSYVSTNTTIATISPTGLLTGVAAGNSAISVTYGGTAANLAVAVLGGVPPPASGPDSVSISGSLAVVAGSSTQLTVIAHYANGSTVNVSSQAVWSSTNGGILSVAGGLILGVGAGNATVTATYQGVSAQVTVSVSAPAVTVTGLQVNGTLNLLVGGTTQLSATATFSDGSTANVTGSVNWSSGSGLASVSASGLVSALAVGGATITGSYQGVSAQVQLTIALPLPVLQSISVSGASSVKLLQNIQLTVTAHYSDGSSANVTGSVAWSTNNGLLSILTPVDGILRALGLGNCLVSATYQGKSAQHSVLITLL